MAGGRVKSFVWSGEPSLRTKRDDRITQCDSVYPVYGKTPTRKSHNFYPLPPSGSGHPPENKSIHSTLPSNMQESPPQKRFLVGCRFERLAKHVTALRAWCKQCPLPGPAPSRHRRDARVYAHMTTAMHDMSTRPPAIPPRYFSPPGYDMEKFGTLDTGEKNDRYPRR